MTYCHKLGSGGWCQSTAPCFPGECKYQSRYTILSTNNTKPAASDEPIILSRCSLRSRLAIESKEREGREALLRENESLRSRLAEAERDADQLLKERDHAEGMADKLADALATMLCVDIGEHSSGNCPWTEALEAFEERATDSASNREIAHDE